VAHDRFRYAVRLVTRSGLPAALALAPPSAWAHSAGAGDAVALEIALALLLAVSAVLYAIGLWRLNHARRSFRGKKRCAALFSAGWTTLAVALVSPLAAATEGLFGAHMIQHELLMVIAAPLLVMGRPLAMWTWALPPVWRSAVAKPFGSRAFGGVWRALSAPLVATVIHGAVIWTWHVPRVFELSQASVAAHALQHAAFIFSALLFWWALLKPARGARIGSAVGCLFVTMLHTGALGVLLTFSGEVWYPTATAHASAWGLTALEDQQLGGLVMWVVGSLPYVIAALALAARWFGNADNRGDVALRLTPR
jgi:putative membrane protein